MFSCWVILKRLVKKKGVLLKSQALHVIDTVLRSIASYGRKDKHGEVIYYYQLELVVNEM